MRRAVRPRVLVILSLAAVAALTGACHHGTIPSGTPGAISAQDFADRLTRAYDLAQGGEASPTPAHMNDVRDAIGLPAMVSVPGGTVTVPEDPFLASLPGRAASDFRNASRHLAAIRSAAFAALQSQPVDRAAIQAALDDAYGRIPRTRPGILERIGRAAANAISAAFRGLVSFHGWQTILEWAVVLVLVLLGVRILARGRIVPDRIFTDGRAAGHESSSPADWRRLAEEALGRGDMDTAVRAMYRALLGVLAARGLVRDDPSLTAGECRQAVDAARPAISPVVDEATRAFERVAYGGLPSGTGDVEALRQAEHAARAA